MGPFGDEHDPIPQPPSSKPGAECTFAVAVSTSGIERRATGSDDAIQDFEVVSIALPIQEGRWDPPSGDKIETAGTELVGPKHDPRNRDGDAVDTNGIHAYKAPARSCATMYSHALTVSAMIVSV